MAITTVELKDKIKEIKYKEKEKWDEEKLIKIVPLEDKTERRIRI